MKQETIKKTSGLHGVLSLTVSALFVKILGFLYKVPLSHILGDEGMGYYNSALSVYALFFILTSSAIPKALSLILTRARLYQTKKAYQTTIGVCIILFSVLGILMSALLSFFSSEIARCVDVSGARDAMLFISPAIMFSVFGALCRGYLLSYDKIVIVGVSECVEASIKLLGGLFFIYLSKTNGAALLLQSAFATLGITLGALISFLILFIYIIVIKGKESICFGKVPFSFSRLLCSILKVSFPLTLTALLFSLSSLFDLSLITNRLTDSGFSSEEAIKQYGNYSTLVLPLISFVSSVVSAFSLSLFPRMSKFHEEKKKGEFHECVKSSFSLLFAFSIFLSCCFFIFGEDYFTLLFSSQSVNEGTLALRVISPAVIFLALVTLLNTSLEAMGKTYAPLITLGVGILLKIPIGYVLIEKYGIPGAASSTVLSYAIAFIIAYFYLVKNMQYPVISIAEILTSLLAVIGALSIGILTRNIVITLTDVVILRLLPMIICVLTFLCFLRILSKKYSLNLRKLSQYTK